MVIHSKSARYHHLYNQTCFVSRNSTVLWPFVHVIFIDFVSDFFFREICDSLKVCISLVFRSESDSQRLFPLNREQFWCKSKCPIRHKVPNMLSVQTLCVVLVVCSSHDPSSRFMCIFFFQFGMNCLGCGRMTFFYFFYLLMHYTTFEMILKFTSYLSGCMLLYNINFKLWLAFEVKSTWNYSIPIWRQTQISL